MSSNSEPPTSTQGHDGKEEQEMLDFAARHDNKLHPLVNEQMANDVYTVLTAFRCINALCVWTFFQPDEYFQSLEPAWQMAFGPESGAWITWEWQHQLRSSLHPALFAVIYYVVNKPMEFLGFFPQFRALILSVLPNIVQALIAGVGNYFTWQLAQRMYGVGSHTAWTTLLMMLFSPWEWFCSTRTFSNCLETTMTITALYFWPWQMTIDAAPPSITVSNKSQAAPTPTKDSPGIFQTPGSIKHLRISLLLAIGACILRPTNLLIWFCILMPTLTRLLSSTSPNSRVPFSDYLILLREGLLCGSFVLLVTAVSDRLYFGEWTFPPYQWLYFNVSQDLAVFYGRNDWHYYLTQGLPLLLTTYLPFALVGLWESTSGHGLRFLFATVIFTMIGSLSLISHKEVRFIYPLLPLLHLITAPTLASFFYTTTTTVHPPASPSTSKTSTIIVARRKLLLGLMLILNLGISGYTTFYQQSGVISATKFLRSEYEALALDSRGVPLSSPDANKYEFEGAPKITDFDDRETFAAFLMPCHSTPWRSQLIYPGLKAWALTCEPPLGMAKDSEERARYRDEADRFYDDPVGFLKREVNTKERPWPRYVVGFEGVEDVLREYYESEMKGFKVRERWRAANSHWHDDWRRKGDVVVWEFVDGSKMEESE